MQAKGIIKVFTILLIAVCLYQFLHTIGSNKVERKAEKIAQEAMANAPEDLDEDQLNAFGKTVKRRFLDSMRNETALNLGITQLSYKDCLDRQLSLGLDLKGGMSLVLEISTDDVLRSLAGGTQDPVFNQAIERANELQKNSSDNYVTSFGKAWEEVAPGKKLSSIFAASQNFGDQVSFQTENPQMLEVLQESVEGAVQTTFNTLKTRVDQFGVANPKTTLQEGTGRILLELPGVDDPTRIRRILQQTAQLEFWHTWENEQVINYMIEANDVLREKLSLNKSNSDSVANELLGGTEEDANDEIAEEASSSDTSSTGDTSIFDFGDIEPEETATEATDEASQSNPLYEKLQLAISTTEGGGQIPQQGPAVGYALGRDREMINLYLSYDEVKAIFPRDLKFYWSAKSVVPEDDVYALYAIRQNPGRPEAILTGESITRAYENFDEFGRPMVGMVMNATGAEKWARMTKDAVNPTEPPLDRNRSIAIVLDNHVYSAPVVQGEITGGISSISGLDDVEEAVDLSNILESGKLEAATKIVQEENVGPSLGAETIRKGLTALIIGLILVIFFMIAYYSTSGIVSNIALLLNLFLIIGCIASIPGASLTLPGLAGILLTIGMAVDANVIIYERIREELAKGKGPKLALTDGYKHSYSAIIDANVTTLITAGVLLFFGLGPVKGFAIILFIGILSSLFTAVLITRLIYDGLLARNKEIKFSTKLTNNAFKNLKFKFIESRKIAYTVSAIVIALGIGSMFTRGFDLGVDFLGGRTYIVQFDQDVQSEQVASNIEQITGKGAEAKTYGSNSTIQVTTSYLMEDDSKKNDSLVLDAVYKGSSTLFINPPTFTTFANQSVKSSVKVGATIADDINKSAKRAVLIGALGIFLYLLVRFKKYEYGAGALSAILHDVLIILSLFSIFYNLLPFSLEIDQAFVAALLTVIGYSINDTVVVFDRIREFLNIHPTTSLKDNYNNAINSTLSRTVITSFTTLIVVVILFIFGTEAIRGFAFALIVGVIVGTYSSVFIASPITYDLLARKMKTSGKKK